jgi:hypothetical protein
MFYELGESNSLPIEELRQIHHVVRIGVGDRDSMVNIEESVQVYRSLPQGELQIFPNMPHPLEKVPVSYLVSSMVGFFG